VVGAEDIEKPDAVRADGDIDIGRQEPLPICRSVFVRPQRLVGGN
jgi:hypothetical protein